LDGSPIAVLWNYAIHGTCFGPDNMLISSDIMGYASELLEQKLNVTALFVNSDAGDISPGPNMCNNAPAFNGSSIIASAVIALYDTLTPSANVSLLHSSNIVDFGPTDLNYTLARFNNCSTGGPIDICSLCAVLHCDLNAHFGASWIEDKPRFTSFLFEIEAEPTLLVTVPGEALVELGWQIRNDTLNLNYQRTFLFGYSNNHLGYYATPNEYCVGGYESQLTFWGINTAEIVRASCLSTVKLLPTATGQ